MEIVKSVQVAVAEIIKNNSPRQVQERIIAILAEQEVASRVELLSQGLVKAEQVEKEGYKLAKPDMEARNEHGEIISSGFSKEAFEKLKKHRELVERWEKALSSAWEGDFGKLKELLKQQ